MAVSRKTVTVLFADVADSTPLGERLDPEALRHVMTRWFDVARSTIERHGGTVEKFIGDAVMGVFGVPEAHEDDAVRAVHTAADLREHLSRLNTDLERDFGVEVSIRVGVNTGEVVAGDPSGGSTFVSGDVVNTAKRLQESAAPAEILIGRETERLVRGNALLEPTDPLVAKGKTTPVHAWRVLAAIRGMPAIARRADTPLVGRDEELTRLRQAYERAVQERVCYLFTLLGAAGIGKSRLAAELFDAVREDSSVLVGRCLPYGDGITFWPLTEILRDLDDAEALAALIGDDAELVYERLCAVTGKTPSAGTQETFWAVRRVCEALARQRPLVLCFEDVHWAEPTMLDLIEYLGGWIRDAPILLLCLARPEFLNERPAWLSGQEHAASLTLQPLSFAESDELLAALGTTSEQRARIAEAAEGNPLFVEQMAAMVAEDGVVQTIPPTIQALLAARLDRLSDDERATVERAAVAGKEFWRDAVVELTPESERSDVGRRLLSLVRKELIRPGDSTARPDDAFRFVHALVRDAAYAGIPKRTRAELHEHFAHWLETDPTAAALDELIGHHLEQAYRYRTELGPLDDCTRDIGLRAGHRLVRAGRSARTREDVNAAIKLLDRALALLPDESNERLDALYLIQGAFWGTGERERSRHVLEQLLNEARARGDRRMEQYAKLDLAHRESILDPKLAEPHVEAAAREAIAVFEELGDHDGLAIAWRHLSYTPRARGDLATSTEMAKRALAHARRAGNHREAGRIVMALTEDLFLGPTPVDEALELCAELVTEFGGNAYAEQSLLLAVAALKAMRGEFDEAREIYRTADAVFAELGYELLRVALTELTGSLELAAGNPDAAEAEFRRGYEIAIRDVDDAFVAFQSGLLAKALLTQGRIDEAIPFVERCESRIPANDPHRIHSLIVRALLESAKGAHEVAIRTAREAVQLAAPADALSMRADILVDFAQILRSAGRFDAAGEAAREARRLYARKGNVVGAENAASLLVEAPT